LATSLPFPYRGKARTADMAILALDTSTPTGSIAVGREGEILAESFLRVRATHSEVVLPEIDRMLGACGLGPSDLRAVVVGGGPGSFTGVRIAASLAKGICHARGLELYSYSSLAAVAYRIGSSVEELFEPRAVAIDDLLEYLDEPERWCFAGDGAGAGESAIRAAGGQVLSEDRWVPRASALLWLAAVVPETGRVADPRRWEPAYIRLPAAQRPTDG